MHMRTLFFTAFFTAFAAVQVGAVEPVPEATTFAANSDPNAYVFLPSPIGLINNGKEIASISKSGDVTITPGFTCEDVLRAMVYPSVLTFEPKHIDVVVSPYNGPLTTGALEARDAFNAAIASVVSIDILAAVIAALGTLCTLLVVLAPQLRKWLDLHVSEADVDKLKAALKGAYVIVSRIAEATPGFPLDDGIAKVLEIATREFEAARGRTPTEDEKTVMVHMALSMHADRGMDGSLAGKDGKDDIAQVVANLADGVL